MFNLWHRVVPVRGMSLSVRLTDETQFQRALRDTWSDIHTVWFWALEIMAFSIGGFVAVKWPLSLLDDPKWVPLWVLIVELGMALITVVLAMIYEFFWQAARKQRNDGRTYIHCVQRNLSVEGSLRRLAELRSEGTRFRNGIESIDSVEEIRDWYIRWTDQISAVMKPLSESEAELYLTLDVVPPSGIRISKSSEHLRFANFITKQNDLVREFVLRFRDHWPVMAPLVDMNELRKSDSSIPADQPPPTHV